MESLTTTCLTCGRRLRVRDPKLIGQIVTCPKCGGMVQIEAPRRSTPQPETFSGPPVAASPQRIAVGPADEVDSQAITRDSLDAEQLNAEAFADSREAVGGTVFHSADDDPAHQPGEFNASATAASAEAAESPGPLPAGWQSDRTRRARQIGLIATLAVTGLVAAAAIFSLFVQRWKAQQSPRTQPAVAANDSASTTDDTISDVVSTGDAPGDETEEEAAGEQQHSTQQPAAPEREAAAPEPSVQGDETATAPEAANDPPAVTGETSADDAPPNEDEASARPTADPTGVLANAVDAEPPNDLMPEPVFGADAGEEKGTAQQKEKQGEPTPDLPAGLKKYTSLLDFGSSGGESQTQLETPPTVDQVALDRPAAQEETAFGPAEPIHVDRWLRMEVAFEKKSAPLSQWLRVLSQVTGVPIALDVASLDAAGIAPTHAVQPVSGWTTADAVLESLARSAGCTVRKTETLVIVEAPTERITAGVQPALRVDDLLADSDAQQRATLAELIKQATQAESVRIDAEDAFMSVSGDPGVEWLATLTLEGLRTVRQLEPRLPRERTERWLAIDQNFDWPIMQGGTGLPRLDHPQPIVSLIGRVAEANDASVIFAWDDLWLHGLTPKSTAMPWTENVSGGDVLETVLEPYRLQVRKMHQDLWWVGSQALYDRDRAVGLIRVPGAEGEVVIQRIARSLGAQGTERLAVAFDPESGYLVAQLPRFLLRQLPELVGANPTAK